MAEAADFKKWILILLDEAFGVTDATGGYFMDNGQDGVLGTLNRTSAKKASTPLQPGHETVVSHASHVLFILQLFEAYGRGETPNADWPGSWHTKTANEQEWDQLRAEIKGAYAAVVARLTGMETWPEDPVAASMILLAHCAYHSGEIRQLLSALPD